MQKIERLTRIVDFIRRHDILDRHVASVWVGADGSRLRLWRLESVLVRDLRERYGPPVLSRDEYYDESGVFHVTASWELDPEFTLLVQDWPATVHPEWIEEVLPS